MDDFSPTNPDLVEPFVYEDERTVSLHFDIASIQSRMRRDDPTVLELDYTRTMMGFVLFEAAPRSILMIGLGGGSLPKYCHRHLPSTGLTVVEINPHVIALRETFHVPDDERLRVVCADGAAFVAHSEPLWPVLLVDGFTYEGQAEQLCTQRFYDDCRAALSPDGVLVVNLHADAGQDLLLLERIERSFDGAVLSVLTADRCNRIVFAGAPCRPGRGVAALCRRWDALDNVHRRTLRLGWPRLLQAARGVPKPEDAVA